MDERHKSASAREWENEIQNKPSEIAKNVNHRIKWQMNESEIASVDMGEREREKEKNKRTKPNLFVAVISLLCYFWRAYRCDAWLREVALAVKHKWRTQCERQQQQRWKKCIVSVCNVAGALMRHFSFIRWSLFAPDDVGDCRSGENPCARIWINMEGPPKHHYHCRAVDMMHLWRIL